MGESMGTVTLHKSRAGVRCRGGGADFGRSGQAGLTLPEVMIAMAISLILMSALAGLFASSVTTRQQVDRAGQSIENARFSIETLSEDIRLAGYFGNYTPAGRWSSVQWQAVSALERVGSTCTAAALTQGWTNLGTGIVRIPVPILGFEAHSGSGTQTIDADITACLPNYLAGTDVLVIRRARTTATTAEAIAGTLSASKTYLQVSACSTEVATNDFTVSTGTTNANPGLKRLGCSSVAADRAPVWELITRMYYVASQNESGDGIPTLKMIDTSAGGTTPVTIATNVVDLHLEYGIDASGYPWTAGETVLAGAGRRNMDNLYQADSGGVAGSNPPTHSTGSVSDGGVSWTFYALIDGSIDAWGRSTADPERLLPNGSTTGTALASPWGGATNWQDVMAVKLSVIVRDPEPTASYTNSKAFVMGSVTVPAATLNARGTNAGSYRYKSSGSTVKVVNMAGRREDVVP
jgi:type IV pilus assembly protein PilW